MSNNGNSTVDRCSLENKQLLDVLQHEYYRVMENAEKLNGSFLQNSSFYLIGVFVAITAISENSASWNVLPIIFPFLLLYYSYNTFKYTIRVLENKGYALALEKRMNKIMNKNIYIENICHANMTPKLFINGLYSRGFYGGIVQISFIIPIAIFTWISFISALNTAPYSDNVKFILISLLALATLTNVILVLLMINMIKRTQDKIENAWKTENKPDQQDQEDN